MDEPRSDTTPSRAQTTARPGPNTGPITGSGTVTGPVTATVTGTVSLLTVTDGRAGNQAQALGLAEALARLAPEKVRTLSREITLRRWAAMLPAAAWDWAGRQLRGWPEAGLRAADGALAPPSGSGRAVVIGAGRRAAPVVAALGRRHGVATVQLLDPQMSPAAFDLVAAPRHDGLTAPNTVATLGAIGRLSVEGIETAADTLPAVIAGPIAALPEPRLAVLLGGGSASARWSDDDKVAFVAAGKDLAQRGWSLIVTPSRRSDAEMVATLKDQLPPDRLFLWEGDGANPYPAMLSPDLASAVLVTADSVNMASEAAASGLPVHVFHIGGLDPKLAAFHRALEQHGAARPFEGEIGAWSYTPLQEADRLARIVSDRLDLGL
ncbi:MAG: mitochondrial fission ELM1 family protein [Pseudomonadota bacterium]